MFFSAILRLVDQNPPEKNTDMKFYACTGFLTTFFLNSVMFQTFCSFTQLTLHAINGETNEQNNLTAEIWSKC